eukprot:6182533-Pleurochrysis_carterae.AAC.2
MEQVCQVDYIKYPRNTCIRQNIILVPLHAAQHSVAQTHSRAVPHTTRHVRARTRPLRHPRRASGGPGVGGEEACCRQAPVGCW